MITLGQALAIAAEAHQDQTDKSGRPYFLHCIAVMRGVKHYKDDKLSIIAILHDLIEDTNWTFSFTENENLNTSESYLYNPLTGNRIRISKRIYDSLTLLTHNSSDTYGMYIYKLSQNKDAILIKLEDLKHNSDITRLKHRNEEKDLPRIAKYHRAYIFLTNALEDLNHAHFSKSETSTFTSTN